MRNLARSAFFFSGLAGLTFEIVWLRHLGLTLGATTLAVATITAAYMGGLAFGGQLGGRWADRFRRPLASYGVMELAVGLLGLSVPWLCSKISLVDALLFADSTSGLTRALVRFAVALGVLIIPTLAMGTTLPILARAVTQSVDHVGRQVGNLYALNLAGAVIGAALSGFYWIPTFGLAATNSIAVGIDVVLGVLALAAGFAVPALPAAPASAAKTPVWRSGGRSLVAMLACTGATAMVLQVLWTRALGTALGPSTYAFSAIVCAYLLGLAIGGFVTARIADRVTAVRMALTVVLLATAGFTLFGITVIDDLPLLLHRIVLDQSLTMQALVRSEFALAALSVLPATICMGAIFPLTLSAVVGHQERLGAAVGRAYAINTWGAIFGSFAGVFILLPLVGVEWGMRAAGLSYVLLALALSFRLEPSVRPLPRNLLRGLAAALILAFIAWPGWNVAQWTAGLFRLSMTRAYYADSKFKPAEVIFHHDGLASTVTVEQEDGVRWIKVNGKIDGSSHGDMPTQILSGILPMLLHPNPQEVAVIGCGSCVTVGAALQENPKHVTLVELEKDVVAAAHLFSDVNHAPWDDARLSIVEDDGRNFLSRSRTPFDVIVSEPSNPWMTGAASLFTQEFFQIAKTRLKQDGVFVQWLQTYELAPQRIASVLKTFQGAFPHVLAFSAHPDSNDLLLVGSAAPVELNMPQLQERFTHAQAELARAELHSPSDLLALLLFTDREINGLPGDVPLNTDDNAYIEFGAPRDLVAFADSDPDMPIMSDLEGKRVSVIMRLLKSNTPPLPEVVAGLARGYLHQGMLSDARAAAEMVKDPLMHATPADLDHARQVQELATLLDGDDNERVVHEGLASTDREYAQATDFLTRGDVAAALKYVENRDHFSKKSSVHKLLYGFLLYRSDRFEDARRTLQNALTSADAQPLRPALTYYLARNAYGDGDYRAAAGQMLRYRQTLEQPVDEEAEE